MSEERWIKVTPDDLISQDNEGWPCCFCGAGYAAELYDAAEGQRVETWRICKTHGSRLAGEKRTLGPYCQVKATGRYSPTIPDCRFEDAVLIFPPENK